MKAETYDGGLSLDCVQNVNDKVCCLRVVRGSRPAHGHGA